MVVVWDRPEPVVMDLVDGRLEVPRARLSAPEFGSLMSSENGTNSHFDGQIALAAQEHDVEEVAGGVFEVLQLLPRHRSRDIEHHGDFEALDLTAIATRHGKLGLRKRLLSLGDQRQPVDVGYLQKRSLDVRRAIRNYRYPVVADGKAN